MNDGCRKVIVSERLSRASLYSNGVMGVSTPWRLFESRRLTVDLGYVGVDTRD